MKTKSFFGIMMLCVAVQSLSAWASADYDEKLLFVGVFTQHYSTVPFGDIDEQNERVGYTYFGQIPSASGKVEATISHERYLDYFIVSEELNELRKNIPLSEVKSIDSKYYITLNSFQQQVLFPTMVKLAYDNDWKQFEKLYEEHAYLVFLDEPAYIFFVDSLSKFIIQLSKNFTIPESTLAFMANIANEISSYAQQNLYSTSMGRPIANGLLAESLSVNIKLAAYMTQHGVWPAQFSDVPEIYTINYKTKDNSFSYSLTLQSDPVITLSCNDIDVRNATLTCTSEPTILELSESDRAVAMKLFNDFGNCNSELIDYYSEHGQWPDSINKSSKYFQVTEYAPEVDKLTFSIKANDIQFESHYKIDFGVSKSHPEYDMITGWKHIDISRN